MTEPLTKGVYHIGLSVSKLEESAKFFVQYLGWFEVRRDIEYPAIFVSDGINMVTLWGMADSLKARDFNRRKNVGLHHVAFEVASIERLSEVYGILSQASDVIIEFAPELLRDGPAQHMMCTETSGIRVEFIWPALFMACFIYDSKKSVYFAY